MRRADLAGDAPLCLLVAFDRGETLAQALFGQILEGARDLFGAALLVGGAQELDLIGVALRLLRHQIAADPVPDWFEAGARDAAAMLAVRRIVDQELLNR